MPHYEVGLVGGYRPTDKKDKSSFKELFLPKTICGSGCGFRN